MDWTIELAIPAPCALQGDIVAAHEVLLSGVNDELRHAINRAIRMYLQRLGSDARYRIAREVGFEQGFVIFGVVGSNARCKTPLDVQALQAFLGARFKAHADHPRPPEPLDDSAEGKPTADGINRGGDSRKMTQGTVRAPAPEQTPWVNPAAEPGSPGADSHGVLDVEPAATGYPISSEPSVSPVTQPSSAAFQEGQLRDATDGARAGALTSESASVIVGGDDSSSPASGPSQPTGTADAGDAHTASTTVCIDGGRLRLPPSVTDQRSGESSDRSDAEGDPGCLRDVTRDPLTLYPDDRPSDPIVREFVEGCVEVLLVTIKNRHVPFVVVLPGVGADVAGIQPGVNLSDRLTGLTPRKGGIWILDKYEIDETSVDRDDKCGRMTGLGGAGDDYASWQSGRRPSLPVP